MYRRLQGTVPGYIIYIFVPQFPQNFIPIGTNAPHTTHVASAASASPPLVSTFVSSATVASAPPSGKAGVAGDGTEDKTASMARAIGVLGGVAVDSPDSAALGSASVTAVGVANFNEHVLDGGPKPKSLVAQM